MFLISLPLKILGVTGTLILAIVLYWLFIGTGMNLNRGGNCSPYFMMQSVKNPISGIVKSVGNPCDVPIGWEKINRNKET